MTFRLMTQIEAVCDTCGTECVEFADTIADGKASLRKDGWVFGEGLSERHPRVTRGQTKPAKCWCSRKCWRERNVASGK